MLTQLLFIMCLLTIYLLSPVVMNFCNVFVTRRKSELYRRHTLQRSKQYFIIIKTINHLYTGGKYQVALPKKSGHQALGESRQQAIRSYCTNERSLHKHGNWDKFQSVVQEYFDLGYAKQVPDQDMSKLTSSVFYMPMHSEIKESSTTIKLRVVFDVSVKSSTGISLNDTLQVGPTIYPSLTDILIRFRSFKIAVSSDISKIYRAVELSPSDRDPNRFVWRRDSSMPLSDYRMTRITFGVAASAFAAIRSLQQTALDFGDEFPLAKPHIFDSFYVDDCLAGADNVEQACLLQQQLQGLPEKGRFLLRKWHSNSTDVLESIPQELKESTAVQPIVQEDAYHKMLGIHWDSDNDVFHVSI